MAEMTCVKSVTQLGLAEKFCRHRENDRAKRLSRLSRVVRPPMSDFGYFGQVYIEGCDSTGAQEGDDKHAI